jgi:hypothetical protein
VSTRGRNGLAMNRLQPQKSSWQKLQGQDASPKATTASKQWFSVESLLYRRSLCSDTQTANTNQRARCARRTHVAKLGVGDQAAHVAIAELALHIFQRLRQGARQASPHQPCAPSELGQRQQVCQWADAMTHASSEVLQSDMRYRTVVQHVVLHLLRARTCHPLLTWHTPNFSSVSRVLASVMLCRGGRHPRRWEGYPSPPSQPSRCSPGGKPSPNHLATVSGMTSATNQAGPAEPFP